jgi:HlyD family secretion protein
VRSELKTQNGLGGGLQHRRLLSPFAGFRQGNAEERLVNVQSLWAICASALLTVACGREPSANTLRVSGHVEASDVRIAAEIGGRLLELRIGSGDRLSEGDIVARIDAREAELQVRRARAERTAADAQLRLLLAGSRPEDTRQAQALADAAAADVAIVDAEIKAATLDLERFEALLQANAGATKQRDDARLRVDVAHERRRGADDRMQATREVLRRFERGARHEEIDGARARVAVADAEIALLQRRVEDAVVVTPVGGVVTQTLASVGEIVSRGGPIAVVTDLDHAWANLFVPEPLIPRIRVGQPAQVHTDAGGTPLPGTVTFISSRAEFTPRNVQTAEERSKLVYRIKVSVDNSAGVLKQGMPVDAELALQ